MTSAATLYRLTDELSAKYRFEAITAVAALVAQAETAAQFERAHAEAEQVALGWKRRAERAEQRVKELERQLGVRT